MDLLPVAQSKDQGREQQHEDDASTTNLLPPPRPHSQRFHSHDQQPLPSNHSQTPRLWQISWWLLTIILSAFILATVKIYQSPRNFNSVQKHVFNTITTALILALGLNFFEAFKSLAKGLKWKILERTYYSPREKDLISNIENLTDVLVLGWESLIKPYRKPWMTLLCIAWIAINILAQISVAMISLTYSVVDGTNWNDTYTRSGVASASNLSCYAFGPKGNCGEGNQARAHAYGDMALAFPCGAYNETSQISTSRQNFRYYCRRNRHQQEFAYRFNEYNFNDTQQAYPRLTQRIVTASAGHCFNYTMVGDPRDLPGGNVFYEYSNGTVSGNITIPGQTTTWDGTTYIYRGSKPPAEAELYACGPRCLWMWAHKARGHGEPSTFYECPITVNPVSNTSNDTQQISDDMARLAAASIATQGRPINANISREYQLYAFGSHWEVHFKGPDQVGANMAEFAIGSISMMASTNPRIPVKDCVPYLGSHVEVKWYYLIPLVAGINGAHLALLMLNIYAT